MIDGSGPRLGTLVVDGHPRPGRDAPRPPAAPNPLSPRLQVARAVLVSLLVLSVSLLMQLLVVSRLYQYSAQQRAFARLRAELAQGTAAIGPTGAGGRALRPGSPVAYLEIPALHLKQVVVEGTSSANLFTGPGHRRDTPLPGQAGVSILLGRRASFGGPFAKIAGLRKGATIRITTGEGTFVYKVLGVRREGAEVPAPAPAGAGRLLLATAAGTPFMPSGVARVDADLTTAASAGPARPFNARSLPASEQIMGTDPGTIWALALWLQFLVLVVLGATWASQRWDRARAWIVFLPPLLLCGLNASGQAAHLLPNLL